MLLLVPSARADSVPPRGPLSNGRRRTARSVGDRAVSHSLGRSALTDVSTIVTVPDTELSPEVMGGGDRLCSEGRHRVRCRELGHAVHEVLHRDHEHVVGELHQRPRQRGAADGRPTTGQRSASRGERALAQAVQVQVRRGQAVRSAQRAQRSASLIGEDVTQEMIVEDGDRHVVARSGSSPSECT